MKKILVFLAVIIVVVTAIWFTSRSPSTPENIGGSAIENIAIKGSDTELQLVSNLVEAFHQKNAKADMSVTGGGSGTGIAALLNGEIEIANSSRPMKPDERNQGINKGLEIQEFIVARDGLAVITHPDNSIETITFDDLGKIYRGETANWKSVGGRDEPIVLYGRQTTSGTYVFFRDTVLRGDYDTRMRNMEGNQAIVDAVKNDRNGIGYVGVGYITDETGSERKDIKVVKIAATSKAAGISPLDTEAANAGVYSLSRPLFQYLASVPRKGSLIEKFLIFESSAEGLEVVSKTGFFPPTQEDIARNELLFKTIGK